jgi:hypothetical protein
MVGLRYPLPTAKLCGRKPKNSVTNLIQLILDRDTSLVLLMHQVLIKSTHIGFKAIGFGLYSFFGSGYECRFSKNNLFQNECHFHFLMYC